MKEYIRLLCLAAPVLAGLSLMGFAVIPDPLIDALIRERSSRDQAGGGVVLTTRR